MDDLRRRFRIAGALAGAIVFAVMLLGGQGLAAALIFGVMAGGFLGAILIWGLAEGRSEDDPLPPQRWEEEPFTPDRRIVAPGGDTVSHVPLTAGGAADAPVSPPLDSVTVQARRPADVPPPAMTAAPAAGTLPPARALGPVPEGVVPGRIEDLTGAPDDEDEGVSEAQDDADLAPARDGKRGKADRKAGKKAKKAAKKLRKAAAGPGTAGLDHLIDRVATVTGGTGEDEAGDGFPAADRSAPPVKSPPVQSPPVQPPADLPPAAEPAAAAAADDLLAIRGLGPMERDWLAGYGITTLAQVAALDEADVTRLAIMMGPAGHRIRTEDWAGQAARLTGAGR